jgi:predicted nucleic acid-binding protein
VARADQVAAVLVAAHDLPRHPQPPAVLGVCVPNIPSVHLTPSFGTHGREAVPSFFNSFDGPADLAKRSGGILRAEFSRSMILVGTGPLVAAANRQDTHHVASITPLAAARPPQLVPGLVIAEVCCLLERDAGAAVEAEFLRSFATGFLTVADLTVADLTRSAELVEQFADLPLGGIGPCLVALAERLPRCPPSRPMPTKPRRRRQGASLERAGQTAMDGHRFGPRFNSRPLRGSVAGLGA